MKTSILGPINLIGCLFVLSASFMAACSEETQQAERQKVNFSLEKASWLIGEWEHQAETEYSYESWRAPEEDCMNGQAVYVSAGDTLNSETLRLCRQGDSLLYLPRVQGQNNQEEVTFYATKQTDNELIFENPSHDFPQIIRYTRVHADSLYAEVSGKINQQEKKIGFPMRRKKITS